MNSFYITNKIAVNPDTQIKLLTNGKSGDDKVTLCVADGIGADDEAFFYLQTNGDPILFTDDIDDQIDFLDLLECSAEDIIEKVKEYQPNRISLSSCDWFIDQLNQSHYHQD
jgi:uncharacterized protein YlzI (FlbEa/FlbD family)